MSEHPELTNSGDLKTSSYILTWGPFSRLHACLVEISGMRNALSIPIGSDKVPSLGIMHIHSVAWVTCMHDLPCQSHGVKLQASRASSFIQVHNPLSQVLGTRLVSEFRIQMLYYHDTPKRCWNGTPESDVLIFL